MRYITFALAKGRLAKKAMALLEEIGITCEEMKDEKTRKLIFVNEELKLKFFFSAKAVTLVIMLKAMINATFLQCLLNISFSPFLLPIPSRTPSPG